MRINQLPVASSVAQTDVLAIDTSNRTYQVPRSVLAPSPYIADIPASQWSGSSGDYYITVSASNVTPSSILIPNYDENSSRYLIGALWCVPGTGSFTIHTSVLPASTVKILVYFLGVMGEAQYQVLSDVYSKSQAVAKADIVDNLTSTSTTAPLSANMGKALNDKIGYMAKDYTYTYTIEANGDLSITAEQMGYSTPSGYVPLAIGFFNTGATLVFSRGVYALTTSGNCVWLHNFSSSRITAVMSVTVVYRKSI